MADHTPRRAGSKSSIASSAKGGSVRNNRSCVRSSSVTDAVAGAGICTTTASSGAGTSPAPRIVQTTSTGQPSRRSQRTGPVAAARAPIAISTGRPAYTSASRADTSARTVGSARSVAPVTWAGDPCASTAASRDGSPGPGRRAAPSPLISRTAAIAAAARGWSIAKYTTPTTAKSSVTLATTLLIGSGEELIASRLPAFTRWDSRAVPPPTTASTAWSRVDASPASSTPITAPTVGRIAVEIASHVESM